VDTIWSWLAVAFWAAVVVGVVVRGARARRRGGSALEGARVALDGADRVQAVVLARPDTGPVLHGSTGPVPELTVDHVDPLDGRPG